MRTLGNPNPATLEATALIRLIHDQCTAEVEEMRAQARQRVERSLAAADAEAESIRAAAHREGAERGQRQAARLRAVAEAESRRQRLLDREHLIEDALRQARAQLEAFAEMPAAAEILAALVHEGLQAVPAGPVRVRVPQGYERLTGAAAGEGSAASPRTVRFEVDAVPGGGVIIESDDGRLRFDNSFAARIRRRATRLRRQAADILFAEGT